MVESLHREGKLMPTSFEKAYAGFVKHVSFPMIARRSGNKRVRQHLRALENSQYDTPDQIQARQIAQLRSLLKQAYQSTRFYRRRFDECGFNPDQFKHPDQMRVIPVLTKNEIRSHLADMLSDRFSADEIHSSETGGTTGVKMKFCRNNSCLPLKEAALLRFEKWGGWDFGQPLGIVWPAQQDYVGHWTRKAKLKNALYKRQVVFPAAVIDDEAIRNYLNLVVRQKPTLIRAFTNPLLEIAKFILKNSFPIPSPKGLITTGEPLYNHQRGEIERAFGCKVYDSYRSREAGPIAQECEVHKGMHINAENLYVESIPLKDMQCDDECIGRIIITDLLNFGMPLIRYDMGDLGVISSRKCSCGRGLPLLGGLKGRSASSFITPDGKIVAAGALVLYLVDEAPGPLGQVQIIQETLDTLILRMTKDPMPSKEILDYQEKTVQRLFGPEMKIKFEFVEKIDREASGKYLFTKCLVENTCKESSIP
jgi:phenylacetate-CoA ligase